MPHRYKKIKTEILDTGLFKTYTAEKLQELRDELENLQIIYRNLQFSVKLVANSLYGACGNQYYRFCNYEVASDITGEGAHHMIACDVSVNKYFKKWEADIEILNLIKEKFPDQADNIKLTPVKFDICNYGDTDSRYIEYGEIFRASGFKPDNTNDLLEFVLLLDKHRISPLFNKVLLHEVTKKNGNCTMKMELEIVGGRGIFLAKKMYVMSVLWKDGKNVAKDGKIKAVGVELRRRTSSIFAKKMQERIIRSLLNPKFPILDVYKLTSKIVAHAKTVQIDELCKITKLSGYHELVESDKDVVITRKGARPPQKGAARWNMLLDKLNLKSKYEPLYTGRLKLYKSIDGLDMGFPVEMDEIQDWMPAMDYNAQIHSLIIKPLQRYLPENEQISNLGKNVIQNSF